MRSQNRTHLGAAGLCALALVGLSAPQRALADAFRSDSSGVRSESQKPAEQDSTAAQPDTARTYDFKGVHTDKATEVDVFDGVTKEPLWQAPLPFGLHAKGRIVDCDDTARPSEEILLKISFADLGSLVRTEDVPMLYLKNCKQIVVLFGDVTLPSSNPYHVLGGRYSYAAAYNLESGRKVYESLQRSRHEKLEDNGLILGSPTLCSMTWFNDQGEKARSLKTVILPSTVDGLTFVQEEELRIDTTTGQFKTATTQIPTSEWFRESWLTSQFQFEISGPGWFRIRPIDIENYESSGASGGFDFAQQSMPPGLSSGDIKHP